MDPPPTPIDHVHRPWPVDTIWGGRATTKNKKMRSKIWVPTENGFSGQAKAPKKKKNHIYPKNWVDLTFDTMHYGIGMN